MNRFTRALIPLAGAALATGLMAAPAFAGGAPTTCPTTSGGTGAPNNDNGVQHNNFGGVCSVTGTISISSTVSFATNVTSFTLSSAALNAPSPQFQIQISSTDGNGYYVSENGPQGGFPCEASSTCGSATLPDGSVAMFFYNTQGIAGRPCSNWTTNAAYEPLPDPSGGPINGAATVLAVNGMTSGTYQNCATGYLGYSPPAGTDNYDIGGWELTTVDGTPSGTYQGSVLLAAWGV